MDWMYVCPVLISYYHVFTLFSIHSGNIIFVGSSTSTALALTWGGLTHPWSSVATLVPLIIGICGLAFFLFYEEYVATNPIVSHATFRPNLST